MVRCCASLGGGPARVVIIPESTGEMGVPMSSCSKAWERLYKRYINARKPHCLAISATCGTLHPQPFTSTFTFVVFSACTDLACAANSPSIFVKLGPIVPRLEPRGVETP